MTALPGDTTDVEHPHIAAVAAELLRCRVECVEALPSTENLVFRVQTGDRDVVLRFTAVGRRSGAELASELAWLRHLRRTGVDVVRPISRSPAGPVLLGDGSRHHCLVFEFAGPEPARPEAVDEALLAAWGGLLGRLHRAASGPDRAAVAARWYWADGRNYDLRLLDLSPAEHAAAAAVLARAASSIRGNLLVHGDLGLRNLVAGARGLTAIDFDDCCWAGAEYDIASTLYDALVDHDLPLPPEAATAALLDGYEETAGRGAVQSDWVCDALAALVVERAITARRLSTPDDAAASALAVLLASGGLPAPLAGWS